MGLILGSKSPRRKELLNMVTDNFTVRVSDSDESYGDDIPLVEVPRLLATKKANAIEKADGDIVIGCDTVVIYKDKLLGKPKTDSEAFEMLKMLSGTTHMVVSGLCVTNGEKAVDDTVITYVTFKELTDTEINNYVRCFHPTDKAGAYGIQESAGAFVTKIEGDFYNVVGLPLCRLCEILSKDFDLNLL